ncbi:hypothetical protein D3C71_1856510 [compost metagenome]
MCVVATGVHHIHLPAMVDAASSRGERQPRGFLDRQGIHVGAQSHSWAWLAPIQDTDHPRATDAGMDLKA